MKYLTTILILCLLLFAFRSSLPSEIKSTDMQLIQQKNDFNDDSPFHDFVKNTLSGFSDYASATKKFIKRNKPS